MSINKIRCTHFSFFYTWRLFCEAGWLRPVVMTWNSVPGDAVLTFLFMRFQLSFCPWNAKMSNTLLPYSLKQIIVWCRLVLFGCPGHYAFVRLVWCSNYTQMAWYPFQILFVGVIPFPALQRSGWSKSLILGNRFAMEATNVFSSSKRIFSSSNENKITSPIF